MRQRLPGDGCPAARPVQTAATDWRDWGGRIDCGRGGRESQAGQRLLAGDGAPQCAAVAALGKASQRPRLPWVPRDEASFKSPRDALIFLSPAGIPSFLLS